MEHLRQSSVPAPAATRREGAVGGDGTPAGGEALPAGSARSACRRVAAWELPLLCLLAPVLIFPLGALPLVGLVAILGLWVARWMARGRVTVLTPLNLPMLVLLLMTLQALYPSVDLALSMPKLYGIVLGVAVYYAVVNAVWGPKGWWVTVAALMATAVGVAALGMVSTAWIPKKLPGVAAYYSWIPRLIPTVQSSFGPIAGIHPNELGGTLAFLLPLPLALLLWSISPNRSLVCPRPCGEHRGDSRAVGDEPPTDVLLLGSARVALPPRRLIVTVALLTLLLAAPVLLLTYSRSSLAAFACAALLLLGLRWQRLGYLLAAAVLIGVATLVVAGPQRGMEWAQQLDRASRDNPTLAGRLELWNRASYMIQDFPFTGIGLNTFPRVLDALYPSFLAEPDARIPHAHNIYLQTAVDLGLAGLMAFMGIWMIVLREAWRTYRRAKGLMRGAVAGLGAGCIAYLLYGVTDAITLGAKPLVLLWIVVALVISANQLVESPGRKGAAWDERRLVVWAQAATATARALYWTLTIFLAGIAYLVVAVSISGLVP